MTYRIGEIATEASVSVEAVRYYERIGLLPKAPRTISGVRRYPHETVDRIRFVKQAQSNGLSLAEIDQKRAQLDEFRRTLQGYADECERSLRQAADPECPVIGKIGRP